VLFKKLEAPLTRRVSLPRASRVGPWDSCEPYRTGFCWRRAAAQDRHGELDVELPAACTQHEPDRAAAVLHDYLELAADIFAVELEGRSIFAF